MSLKQYIAIDLKSFYASVECAARGLDPLDTNLVVADKSRTDKTICLAVSPPLKAYGIPGRARLFEVIQRVSEVNAARRARLGGTGFDGSSVTASALQKNPRLRLDYIVAPPRMAEYLSVSTKIFGIYLKYIAPEDIHVYSVDEVFIDATPYLKTYRMTARQLAYVMIRDVLAQTGITATAGIGTNLYLCKIAMDVLAKHMPADELGVRIAELDEQSYRKTMWAHRPITDFWRIGGGYSRTLARYGMFTMGDVARMSLQNEDLLYRLFGVNAELLIDHAWGSEPCTMQDIKSYTPQSKSISAGQVLPKAYDFEHARLIIREMAEQLAFDLLRKGLAADQMVLTVCYDIQNLKDPGRRASYRGEVKTDPYGRQTPRHTRGTESLGGFTFSEKRVVNATLRLFDRTADPQLLVRRMFLAANHTVPREKAAEAMKNRQLSLFDTADAEQAAACEERERAIQYAVLSLKRRFGKNAVLKGFNFLEGATARERNAQIGGHRA